MKNLKKIPVLALMGIFTFGCASKESQSEKKEMPNGRFKTDSAVSPSGLAKESDKNAWSDSGTHTVTVTDVNGCSTTSFSSSAARVNKDSARKFLRAAELKFRVQAVIPASYRIEDIVSHFDGFVTYTNLSSSVNRRSLIPVSPDSAIESISYTVNNDLVIRVPDTKLDTTLKSIATLVDFLDYRIITAEDVSLTLMGQKLAESRLKTNTERIQRAIDNQGYKLPQTTDAEEKLLDRHSQQDEIRMQHLRLLDQVSYSTIKINLYQREAEKRSLVATDKPIPAYEP
ncbi:MAG TPA: DUF4349 domain-containing protein, partial [Bacteroidia bacterium]|nr:DUF4349 domain-containing protein [Bacteroidia bacterium]